MNRPYMVPHDPRSILRACARWTLAIAVHVGLACWSLGNGAWPRAIVPAAAAAVLGWAAWQDIDTRLTRLGRWARLGRRW